MPVGQTIVATWTGNPSSPVPMTVTIVDDYSVQITAETAALVLKLQLLQDELAAAGLTLLDLIKSVRTAARLVSTFNDSLAALAVTQAQRNAVLSMQVANQIQTNNFFKAVNGETPTMPSVKTQLITSVRDSAVMTQVANTEGAFNTQLNMLVSSMQDYAKSFLSPIIASAVKYVGLETLLDSTDPAAIRDKTARAALIAGSPPPPLVQ